MKPFFLFFPILLLLNLNVHAQIFDLIESPEIPPPCPHGWYDHLTDAEGNIISISEGMSDDTVYLVKKTPAGVLLWKVLTHGYTFPKINLDAEGNIYFFANEQYVVHALIAKYDPDGNLLWERIFKEENNIPGFIFPDRIETYSDGSILIGGHMSGSIVFDDYTLRTFYKDSWDVFAVYLVKLNSQGAVQWGKIFPTLKDEYIEPRIHSIKVDSEHNIYICADMDETTYVDGYTISPNGEEGALIAKFSPSGNLIWATQAGGEEVHSPSICLGDSNFVYFHSTFMLWDNNSTATLGDLVFHKPTYCDTCEVVDEFNISGRINQNLVPQKLYRINAGGPELQDAELHWAEDRQAYPSSFLDPASSNHTTGTFYSWNKLNSTGAPKDIFGTNRYQISWGSKLAYEFPVAPGLCLVNLYFAEKPSAPGVSEVGQRLMDIKIEGNVLMNDLDIYAKAGMNALKESFLVYSDDLLEIEFLKKTGNPQVNGIEIISMQAEPQEIAAPVARAGFSASDAPASFAVAEANGLITVTLSEEQAEPFRISLYDMQGRIHYDEQFSQNEQQVTIGSQTLLPGIYIIKAGAGTMRFIKQ